MRNSTILLWLLMMTCMCTLSVESSVASRVGAIVLKFNTSVRAEGMGGAGVAQHWGGDPNLWANPANIANQVGLRFSQMESRLVPDLSSDIYLRDKWTVLSMGGIGLYIDRSPINGATLEMGEQPATNDDGTYMGTFSSWMKAKRIGAGINVFEMLETFGSDSKPDISKYFDVSLGYVHIDYEDALADDSVMLEAGGTGTGRAASYGALARLTPINTINNDRNSEPLGGFRVSLAYGMSVLNKTNTMIVYEDNQRLFPTSYLNGWSIHVETGLPSSMRETFELSDREWLIDSLTPFISFGYARQTVEPGVIRSTTLYDYEYGHDNSGIYDDESSGWELTIANVWSIRKGHRKTSGNIDGDTTGSSLGFKFQDRGGIRWDKATVPQALGLSDVKRESWTVWVNLNKW